MSLTSVIRYAKALDSAATDGSGKTALAFGDITAKYLVQGGTLTTLTTETITTLGTYQAPSDAAHIRIKELSSSDPTKGIYEVHFHNTQVASSGKKLWLFLSATGAAFAPLEVDLVTTSGDLTVATVTNQLTAAAIATGIWQDTTAGDFTTAGSIGKSLFTSGNVPGAASGIAIVGSNMGITAGAIVTASFGTCVTPETAKTAFLPSATAGAAGGVFIAGTNAATSVTTSFTTTFTGNLTGNVGGNVTGSVGSIAGVTFPSNFASFSIDASGRVDVIKINGTSQTTKDLGAINVTALNTLSGHDPGATLGTSTLTQTQVTGYAGPLLVDSDTGKVQALVGATDYNSNTVQSGDAYAYLVAHLGTPPTASENAAAILAAAQAAPIYADVRNWLGTAPAALDGSGYVKTKQQGELPDNAVTADTLSNDAVDVISAGVLAAAAVVPIRSDVRLWQGDPPASLAATFVQTDRAGKAVIGPRSAEGQDMTTRLEHAEHFVPELDGECDITVVPLLAHEATREPLMGV